MEQPSTNEHPVHEMPGYEPANAEALALHQTDAGKTIAQLNCFLRQAIEEEIRRKNSAE